MDDRGEGGGHQAVPVTVTDESLFQHGSLKHTSAPLRVTAQASRELLAQPSNELKIWELEPPLQQLQREQQQQQLRVLIKTKAVAHVRRPTCRVGGDKEATD